MAIPQQTPTSGPHDHYTVLANQLIDLVGGLKNIRGVSHCTTRLRFQLHHVPHHNIDAIKKIPDVIAVLYSAGQFQIIIGSSVERIYEHIAPQLLIDNRPALQRHAYGLIDTITGIFTPILWLLSGAGIVKGFLILFATLGWLTQSGGTYRLLYAASDAVFFFLPIFLGYTSAKKFGGNPLFSIAIATALIHPEIVNHVNWLFQQKIIHHPVKPEYFIGFPITYLNYATSVLPIIFASWLNATMEHWVTHKLNFNLNKLLVVMLNLLVVIPLTFLIIGPLSNLFADGLSDAVMALYNVSSLSAGIIIGFGWQILVVFGLHWSLVPVALNNVAMTGYDVLLPLFIPAVFGQMGACLGVSLKTRVKTTKAYAGSAALTAVFGITEPALYGVTLRQKRIFFIGCFAGGIGSGIIGYFQAKAYTTGILSLFSFVQIISPKGINDAFYACIIATLITIIIATVLSYLLYTEIPETEESTSEPVMAENDTELHIQNSPNHTQHTLLSPLSGKVFELNEVADSTFASGLIGQGIAIRPTSDTLLAPFDGVVSSIFKTHHSIALTSQSGVELLIHIGIDTVKLQGRGFEPLVTTGQAITAGTPLIHFDLAIIREAGFDSMTPIIVTNSDDYLDIINRTNGHIEAQHPLITIL